MAFKAHIRFSLSDRSFQSITKRDITKLAESYLFSPAEIGKINVIVSEMVSNLMKHNAEIGELLVKPFGKNNIGFEIICIDQGPGMSDPQRMLEDGVSTAGTSGQGLGAIKRMSDEFDLYSAKGVGTVILARIYKKRYLPKANTPNKFNIGVVMVPKTGETDCGDGWAILEDQDTCRILVADGLGHGGHAQIASQSAVETFLQEESADPAVNIRQIHNNIKRTRGVVASVALIDLKNLNITYCGVGNIGGRVLTGMESHKSLISYNGILGHNIPMVVHNHVLPWNNNNLLILHSDGLKSKWDVTKYKNLHRHDPSILAALLYKEFARGTDDILILVGRTRG